MAKKFVRGVTGVDDIDKLDKSLTNVNDIISDGQNTYVHTIKGKTESYYNLTDNVRKVQASGETINVERSNDGTVNLSTNPQTVLEHRNLLTDYGISKTTSGNTTKLGIEYTKVPDGFDLNTFTNGQVVGTGLRNSPKNNEWFFVKSYTESNVTYQEAVMKFNNNIKYVRTKNGSVWSSWREQVGDKSVIDGLLAQKQNKLSTGDGFTMIGDTITLKTFDGYSENLNYLTYTCIAKPVDNTPNLPSGVYGNGILTCLRVGDVVIQKYYPFTGNKLYIRSCTGLPKSPIWKDWTLLS